MKAVVAAFNQEKALVGAISVIVQLHRLIVCSTNPDCVQYRQSSQYLMCGQPRNSDDGDKNYVISFMAILFKVKLFIILNFKEISGVCLILIDILK